MLKVTLPEMGESVAEGSIVEWRKRVGEYVQQGETLVEITTDKVDVEVPAPESGVVTSVAADEGAKVSVGALLAEIDTSKRSAAAASDGAASDGAVAPAVEPSGPPQLVTVAMPEMGESVTNGTVVEWLRKPGDFVNESDPLVEITTDKVDVEVPSTASGVITKLLVDEGTSVAVGAPLVEIDAAKKIASGSQTAAVSSTPVQTKEAKQDSPSPSGEPPRDNFVATPQARRIANRFGIDLRSVRGSGPDGLILREDLDDAIADASPAGGNGVRTVAASASAQLPPLHPEAKVTTLKGPPAMLADYMEQSLSVPTATSFRTIPVDVLDARRKELGGALRAAGRPEKVSFTHLIAFALVRAAHEMPAITAHFRRDGTTPQRIELGVHLGLAVDAQRKDGSRFLIVPVIKNADTLDFGSFRKTYEELVTKSREGKLTADDLSGASFTLTNPGGIGTVASVPRLMAGQGAIIAAGAIGYPPGMSRANESALRSMGVERVMTMTSTYDHRVIQGAQSGEFLRRVDELLSGKDDFYEAVFAALGLQAKATPQLEPTAPQAPGAAPSDEMLRAVAAGHGDHRFLPHARTSRGDARSARRATRRRPGARSAKLWFDARAASRDSGIRAARQSAGQYVSRRAAAHEANLQLHNCLRDRTHFQYGAA